MEDTVKDAKFHGYATTLFNRRRYIPELSQKNYALRQFGERTAMNAPIQGTAADIIKKAMIDVANAMKEKQVKSRLLLQVHDELIFEVPQEELDLMIELVTKTMEDVVKLQVPIKSRLLIRTNMVRREVTLSKIFLNLDFEIRKIKYPG